MCCDPWDFVWVTEARCRSVGCDLEITEPRAAASSYETFVQVRLSQSVWQGVSPYLGRVTAWRLDFSTQVSAEVSLGRDLAKVVAADVFVNILFPFSFSFLFFLYAF